MPAVGFSADLQNVPLTGETFPDGRTYAQLSGPPGGPLFVVVKPLPGGRGDLAALEQLVRETFAADSDQPLTFGPSGEIEVDGADRPAVLFYIGQRHPLTSAGAIAVGIDVPDAPGGWAALALIAGCAGTPDFLCDPLAVAGVPSLCQVLETFHIGDVEGAEEPDEPVAQDAEASAPPEPAFAAEPAPPSAAEPEPGLTTAAVEELLRETQAVMRRAGLWRDAPPDANDYATMTAAQQMAWSLQSSLPAAESAVLRMIGHGPEAERGAAQGVVQMLAAWPEIFRPYPEASELVHLLSAAYGA